MNACRQTKIVGAMAGLGYHLHNGVQKWNNTADMQLSNQCVQQAGMAFNELWCGCALYHDMLDVQAKMFGKGRQGESKIPMAWQVSSNLGNSPHLDRDASHSFAVWATSNDTERATWWFLLPSYGVAIHLRNGVYCSWDGAKVQHCTAVPSTEDVQLGELLSIFTAVPNNLAHVKLEKTIALTKPTVNNVAAFLKKGDKVFVKWFDTSTQSKLEKIGRNRRRRLAAQKKMFLPVTFQGLSEGDLFMFEDTKKRFSYLTLHDVNRRIRLT